MKLTRHNGRAGKNVVYNPKHNDRRFDVGNSGRGGAGKDDYLFDTPYTSANLQMGKSEAYSAHQYKQSVCHKHNTNLCFWPP